MANFADTAPIDELCRRLAAPIPLEPPRARSERLFYQAFCADPRCARALSRAEAARAPDWARRAAQRGAPAAAFDPHPALVGDLRRVARDLREACAEHAHFAETPKAQLSTRDIVMRQLLGEFLAKIERMPLSVIAEKARFFARERALRLKELKANAPLFAREEIYAAPGRAWRRIVSVGELANVGREFANCLAGSTRHHLGYARRLTSDDARFWVLRDHAGAARVVAMVEAASGRLIEARGPRNAPVRPDDPDLAALARVLIARAIGAQKRARAEPMQ